ncbi:MAG: putative replicase [Cressdnaviricota sp.]|nr:MAG: putative replicase [Cressdnaviricota sp.]
MTFVKLPEAESLPVEDYPKYYLGFRLDECPDIDNALLQFRLALSPFGDVTKATFGDEIAVKTKKSHFHYHCEIQTNSLSKKWLKGMSSYISRNIDLELPKGKYCIKPPQDTDTFPSRWFGYPLKDYTSYDSLPLKHILGFTDDEIKSMWLQASAERKASLVIHEKHENKMNNDKQSRALLWKWLDDELPNLGEKRFRKSKATGENVRVDDYLEAASKIVEYNRKYNDYKIPMDLQRRTIAYLVYREVWTDEQVAKHILKY